MILKNSVAARVCRLHYKHNKVSKVQFGLTQIWKVVPKTQAVPKKCIFADKPNISMSEMESF